MKHPLCFIVVKTFYNWLSPCNCRLDGLLESGAGMLDTNIQTVIILRKSSLKAQFFLYQLTFITSTVVQGVNDKVSPVRTLHLRRSSPQQLSRRADRQLVHVQRLGGLWDDRLVRLSAAAKFSLRPVLQETCKKTTPSHPELKSRRGDRVLNTLMQHLP